MSHLFAPLALGPLQLSNRIVVAPMCQYSSVDGEANDWHVQHWGTLSQSGAGLLITEATAVDPAGRISWADLGLYDDATEAAFARALASVRRWSPMPVGVQLAHAGRKASTLKPWEAGGGAIPDGDPRGWEVVAPSAIPYNAASPLPRALDQAGIDAVVAAFAEAARRAARLGLDLIEVHAAHGYLLHQFLSPLSNRRNDAWGGDFDGRARLCLEVVKAVRAVLPAGLPLAVRVSHTDWMEGGWNTEETVELSRRMKALGVDLVDVSSGGLHDAQKIVLGPLYQVPGAVAVKQGAGVAVAAVGLITTPQEAQSIIAEGKAEFALLARAFLRDPYWSLHAAAALGQTERLIVPPQYERGWNTLGRMHRAEAIGRPLPPL